MIRNELILLDRATQAIERITTIGEVKTLTDQAAAIKLLAAKQNWSHDQQVRIAKIELTCVRRLGQLLKETPKAKAGRPKKIGSRKEPILDGPPTHAEMGVNKKQAHVAQNVAAMPESDFQVYLDKDKATVTGALRAVKEKQREAKREQDRKAIAKAPDFASIKGRFATIAIDPPWDVKDESDVDQLGRGRPDYDTMPIADIKALPVGEKAAKDAHLYLWITNRSLPKGFDLLNAWGFRYVTCLTWCKPSFGMGNYFRGSTEQVLFGVRGSLSLQRKDIGTWFAAPRTDKKKHSAKPPEFYRMVETCSPGPYLEVFGRGERPGWIVWGSQ